MKTVVRHLGTGKTYEYSCEPAQAVVCAYEQYGRANWHTWDYDFSQAKVAGSTVYCGDFAAPFQSGYIPGTNGPYKA